MTQHTETPDTPEGRAVRALLAPLESAPPALSPESEARLWARFQGEMAAPPSRFRTLFGGPLLGGLALVGAAAAAWVVSTPAPVRVSEEGTAPAAPAEVAAAPDVVTSQRVLPSGAQIEVHGGRVRLAEATPGGTRLVVDAGGVTSRVPKLAPGAHYLVETPQALVSVHGTRFTVTRSTPTTTRVEVTEGLVSVDPPGWRPEFFLRPGEAADVGPCPDAPEAAAASTADWRCTADGLLTLAAGAADKLERGNLRLRAGRLVTEKAPRQGAEIWRALLADAPDGIHAEEAAFELGRALHLAGDATGARAAGAEFCRRFPRNPRCEATKQF